MNAITVAREFISTYPKAHAGRAERAFKIEASYFRDAAAQARRAGYEAVALDYTAGAVVLLSAAARAHLLAEIEREAEQWLRFCEIWGMLR